MKIYRDGKEIELTAEETLNAYRETRLQLQFRIEDAVIAVENYNDSEGTHYKFDRNGYETIAQRFIDRYDRNVAENDLLYDIVREFTEEYEEFMAEKEITKIEDKLDLVESSLFADYQLFNGIEDGGLAPDMQIKLDKARDEYVKTMYECMVWQRENNR